MSAQWKIVYVEYPKKSPVDSLTLHWEVTDGEARVYGSVTHELDPTLTQAQIKGKSMADLVASAKVMLGVEEVVAIEKALAAQLADLARPSVLGFVPA